MVSCPGEDAHKLGRTNRVTADQAFTEGFRKTELCRAVTAEASAIVLFLQSPVERHAATVLNIAVTAARAVHHTEAKVAAVLYARERPSWRWLSSLS